MALPSIILPEYKIKLLLTNKEITIRPLTVREEKILLMALEGGTKEIAYGIKQILKNCIIDNIDLDNLYFFELLYIFMHIKRVSSGEIIKCQITEKDKDVSNVYEAICNLNEDIVVDGIENLKQFDDPIKITGNDIYIEVKPIKFKDYIKLIGISDKIDNNDKINKDKIDFIYKSMLLTINKIYSSDETFDPNDYTIEELESFYESFPQNDKLKLQKKYEYMPRIALKFHYTDNNGIAKTKLLDKVDFNFFK